MKNIKIVVMSKSYEAALGISRSLKKDGYSNVDLFFIGPKNIASKSNTFKDKYFIAKWDENLILKTLVETYNKNNEKIILFLGDDRTTVFADKHRKELSSIFTFTYVDGNQEGAITHLMDKQHQTIMAKEFGLPMVQSWTAEFIDGCFAIPNGIIYPCFVKPLVSANGPAKSIMKKCENEGILKNHLAKIAKAGYTYPVIVQEFVEIEEEYNIHGICDGDRIFIPIIHKKIATANYNKGVTVLGRNLKPELLEPNIEKLKRLLLSNGYHGIINVEMFLANGKYYLNEINYRIAGTCWGATGAGTNLPALWCETLSGNVREWPDYSIKFDSVFINDKTAAEDLSSGYCSLRQFNQWNKEADFHLIYSEEDKGPWKEFRKMMVKRYLKRKVKKLLGR